MNNLQILFNKFCSSRNIPSSRSSKKFSTQIFQHCGFVEVLLSMLAEFVMATDLDKPATISIIDLLIGNNYL